MADTIDYGNVDSFIPEIIAQMVLKKLPGRMNLARTVVRDWELTPEKKGRVVTVGKTGTLTAKEKSANTALELQAPEDDEVQVTLDQHWYVDWLIEDVARAFAKGQVEDLYVDDAVLTLAEKIETTLAALYASAGDTVSGNANATYGTQSSRGDYTKIRRKLIQQKVPEDALMHLYLDPYAYEDILNLPAYTQADKVANSVVLADGALGRVAGLSVFESNYVQTSGSPTTYHNLAYTKDAMVLAVRPLANDGERWGGVKQKVLVDENTGVGIRLTTSYSHDYLGPRMTLDVLFGVSTLRSEHLIDFQTTGY